MTSLSVEFQLGNFEHCQKHAKMSYVCVFRLIKGFLLVSLYSLVNSNNYCNKTCFLVLIRNNTVCSYVTFFD